MKQFMLLLALLLMPVSLNAEDKLVGALEAGWQGKKVCELLFEDENIRTLRCTFPPGIGHEKHYHPPHFGYILSGGPMQITDASGQEVTGSVNSTGSSWQSDGVDWHIALNVGQTTTQYLIIEQKEKP